MNTTTTQPLYRAIATAIAARTNCDASGNREWFDKWSDRLEELEKELPSGSGFDSGTQIDLDRSTGERLVLHTSYHHMNDGGYYDGWTEHTITVKGSLLDGFDFRVSGRNRSDIKGYIDEMFAQTLRELVSLY